MEGLTIAIIEDDALVRRALQRDLRSLGYNVIYQAGGGSEFLEMIKKGPRPDIILTDMRMPGMDGTEMMSILSQLYTGLRIVALTAYSDDSFLRAFKKYGGVGYIMKPWDPPERLVKIFEMIMAGQTYFQEVATVDYLPKAAGE